MMEPAKPAFTLDELLSASKGVSFDLEPEDKQWLDDAPIGKELSDNLHDQRL